MSRPRFFLIVASLMLCFPVSRRDVAALESRFPGAAMYGGPVARRAAVAGAEDEDDGAPLILHRRPDWQSGMGGSIALQKLVAKQPPLIPALTATDPSELLAPPVFVANLKQWTPFLQWTGQDKSASASALAEGGQSKAIPSAASEQDSFPDTADDLYVADDAERDEAEADREDAQIELDELFALYPPPPRKSRGLSRRAMQERVRAQEEAWKEEEDQDGNTPWPASVLNKSTRAEWTALPGSQSASVSLPLLPPAAFPTIAATPTAAAVLPTAAETSSSAVIPSPTDSTASLVAPADSIPVSSLRSWDFLLFFGCSSWTPRALADEIDEGTWFLMEGNAHHIFTQHTHIPLPGEAEAEAALQLQKQKAAEAEEARRAARVKQLLGEDTPPDEQVAMSQVLQDTESDLLQHGLARAASAASVDVTGKTVSAEPVAEASAPAPDAELTSLLQSLQSRSSELYAEFQRLSSRLTKQQQKNILRLLTAPTAAAADPAALREALRDFVTASVKITSALEESRAIVLPDEEPEKQEESAAPLVSKSTKPAAALKASRVPDNDAADDDDDDDEKITYPDPISQRMQNAFSTPVIPQAVYTAVMAHHLATQQQQAGSQQSALTASASASVTESFSSALVPVASSAASSALAPLPLSLPPVLFPWQRLWHHALWQLGGEARSWSYLPHQPFDHQAALHDEQTDDWEHDEDEEDDEDEDEWDDDDDNDH